MRPASSLAAPALLLLALLASPARCQDDGAGGGEPAGGQVAGQEGAGAGDADTGAAGPAAPAAPAAPAVDAPPARETTSVWLAFSRQFADELRAAGRIPDAAEEYGACAALAPRDLDVVGEAVVMMVDHAGKEAHGLDAGSPWRSMIDGLLRMGVQRGGVGDGRLAYAIGRLNVADGNYQTACDMFREAGAAGFDESQMKSWYFVAAVNSAPELLAAGRVPEVIAELETLVATQPDHPRIVEAKINLAAAYRRRNDRVKSQEILDELVRDHPDDFRVWNAVGRENLDQARLDEALDAYRRSLSLAGADRDGYAQALASVATVLYKLGRLTESEAAVRSFMALDSESVAALYLLARLKRDAGDSLDALKLLRRADRISETDDQSVLTLMEQILYERGELEEAEAVRKRRDAAYHEPGKASERENAEPADD